MIRPILFPIAVCAAATLAACDSDRPPPVERNLPAAPAVSEMPPPPSVAVAIAPPPAPPPASEAAPPEVSPSPPPSPQPELVPPPPPGAGPVVWQPGHWRWTGVAGSEWRWVPGRYAQRPPGATDWVIGQWQQVAGGWAWSEGHWD